MQKQISTLIGIIIIVAVAVILFGGVFAYQYFSKPQQNSEFFAVRQKNNQTQIQTAGWKTYKNADWGIEFKYPEENWILDEQSEGYIKLSNKNKKYYDKENQEIPPIRIYVFGNYKTIKTVLDNVNRIKSSEQDKINVNGLTFSKAINFENQYYQEFWLEFGNKERSNFLLFDNDFEELSNITNQILSTFKFTK